MPALEIYPTPSYLFPSRIEIRQVATTTVAATDLPAGGCPGQYSGGVLAGAIVGSIFGTLLLVFLWSAITNIRGPVVVERETKIKRRGHRSRSGSGSHSSVRRPSRVYSTRS